MVLLTLDRLPILSLGAGGGEVMVCTGLGWFGGGVSTATGLRSSRFRSRIIIVRFQLRIRISF